ncbi:MAG: hypothetical protein P9E24_00760 [Candidatus Competibacter sp.]|nr:hypothetical protein [Candidatus Competibacter sp.]MDG4585530.1 hypothetical protein [Candidatus Competibacter sp.]
MSIRRDYKPASTWQRRRRSARRHGLLVMTLVLIGLFGGLLTYIKGDRIQQPVPVAAAAPGSAPDPSTSRPAATEPPPVAPETMPAPLKPKYDFYTELPKRQIKLQQDPPGPHGASRSSSAHPRPAAEPLRKPAPSRKNRITPTMIRATASQIVTGRS